MSANDIVAWGTAGAALVALAGVFWGIYQYTKGLKIQRQQVLFGLIKELNDNEKLDYAKQLLGYGHVLYQRDSKDPNTRRDYKVDDLIFLKNPKEYKDDEGEIEIKDSLDSFIVFLGTVGYSLQVGAIAANEVTYFQYWIHRTIDNQGVMNYASSKEFPLFLILVKELLKPKILDKWNLTEKELNQTRKNLEKYENTNEKK